MKKLAKKANAGPDGPWFLAAMTVTCGLMGCLLLHAVEQTQYFVHMQGMAMPRFLGVMGTTVCLGFVGLLGIGLTFAAKKFADELWERRHG